MMNRLRANCRCGWTSPASYSQDWAEREAANHLLEQDTWDAGHATFVTWEESPATL